MLCKQKLVCSTCSSPSCSLSTTPSPAELAQHHHAAATTELLHPEPTPAPPSATPTATSTPVVSSDPAQTVEVDHSALLAAEKVVVDSESAFGVALKAVLSSAGPIRDANFDLLNWLHDLDAECSTSALEIRSTSPASRDMSERPSTVPRNAYGRKPQRDPRPCLCPTYAAEFEATFGTAPSASMAIAAFSEGTLSRAYAGRDNMDADVDAYIRQHPPVWHDPDSVEFLATVCAQLYRTLRSGFDVLPPGTQVDRPTETANYRSVDEFHDDVAAEFARLRKLGHVITWNAARWRHPSLRGKQRPDHVLALGAVVKTKLSGKKKVRMVIDPSRATARSAPHEEVPGLNEGIELPDCSMPTVHQASRGLFRGSWSFKADAVDAYLQTKHSVDSLRHVGIQFDDVLMVYDSLSFGLRHAPAHQQRLAVLFSRLAMRRWRAAGIDIGELPTPDLRHPWPRPGSRKAFLFCYLDDWFAVGFTSKAQAQQAYDIFTDLAQRLGLELQYEDGKTVPPTQRTDFLGVIFCSTTMTLSLSPERIAKMLGDLDVLSASGSCSVRDLESLIGVFMFATIVFSFCRPHLRALMNVLRSVGPCPAKHRRLQLSAEAQEDIAMWRRILTVLDINRKPVSSLPLSRRTATAELYTDASFMGGGFFIGGIWHMWRWPADLRERIGNLAVDDAVFICELEALALLVAWRVAAPLFAGRYDRVVCHIDNKPLVDMLLRHSSRSTACTEVLKELTWLMLAYGPAIVPRWIATADNEAADLLSRASSAHAAELLATLRDWSARSPDITTWKPLAPARPDLLPHIIRHPFSAPGSQVHGTARCSCSYALV